ncbi:MAG: hypothetical protein KBG48_17895 [Kofleriaceae bacterium]|jgi:hypothetical protein|nr:hypothetical protein [Kofleriaceae bacterium]MBP9169276.1 hypothetical protein [Kofleriaceae bacterium]MBP9859015.1 hypothetical protein [Kofleriaceae bacterium]
MATPLKFRATGAVIVKHMSPHRCMVAAVARAGAPLDLTDEKRWFEVSFLATPTTAPSWDQVLFDDRGICPDAILGTAWVPLPTVFGPDQNTDGIAISTIGPLAELPRGQYVGSIHIESSHHKKLGALVAGWLPSDAYNYEFTSVAFPDGTFSSKRYTGFECEVTSIQGRTATLDIFDRLDRAKAYKSIQVDLDSPEDCTFDVEPDLDLAGSAEKMLAKTPAKGDRGGLYINLRRAYLLRGPKMPVGMG